MHSVSKNSIYMTIAILALSACQTVDTVSVEPDPAVIGPASRALGVAERPTYQENDTYVYSAAHEGGEQNTSYISEIQPDGEHRWTSSGGFTGTRYDMVTWTSWDFEDGDKGTNAFEGESLYPIEVGRKTEMTYSGQNNEDAFSGYRTCEVLGEVAVTVPAGTFDTFHIVCTQGSKPGSTWRKREFYYAPEIGNDVLHIHTTEDGKTNNRRELVSYQPAGA